MKIITESFRWVLHHVFKQRYVTLKNKINYGPFDTYSVKAQEKWEVNPRSYFVRRIRFDRNGNAHIFRWENIKSDRYDILNDGMITAEYSFINKNSFWSPYIPFQKEPILDYPNQVVIHLETSSGKKESVIRRVHQNFGLAYVHGPDEVDEKECILLYKGGRSSQVGTFFSYRRNMLPTVLGWSPIKGNEKVSKYKKVYPTYNVEE